MDEASWIETFKRYGAFWLHDGNPKRPHALTTTGRHTGGYFNGKIVVENPRLISHAALELVQLLEIWELNEDVDRVVGPGVRGLIFAFCVANQLGFGRKSIPYAFVEIREEGKNKRAVFTDTSVLPGERVLLVDDVLTTGESLDLTAKAVEHAGGIVLKSVAVLVNRSGKKKMNGRAVLSFVRKPMPTWTPQRCPLCKLGLAEAIPPKEGNNWARLNAEY